MARKKTEKPIEIPVFVTEEVIEETIEEPEAAPAQNEPSEMTLNDILNIIEKAYNDFPMGKTYYEIRNFELGGCITPTRAYRRIGELLFEELDNYFAMKLLLAKQEVDLEKLTDELEQPMRINEQKIKRAEMDSLAVSLYRTRHGVNESLNNVSYLFNEFKNYPQYTRSDLESQEAKYHITKSLQQINGDYNLESLNNIFLNLPEEIRIMIENIKQKKSQ